MTWNSAMLPSRLCFLLSLCAVSAYAWRVGSGVDSGQRRQISSPMNTQNVVGASSQGDYPWELGLNVTLDYGTFIGYKNESTGILTWRGVKYADGTGERRFRAPISPPQENLGVVNATAFAPICIQANQIEVVEDTSEDCLYANVYVPPGTKTYDKLPVQIYYHGGGFQTGDTRRFHPYLLYKSSKRPFIFVSFPYRLGALGFLGGSQVAKDGDGNAALLDQWASMKWIKQYIHKFGGDPNDVTIWGQSAGATVTMSALLGFGGKNEGLFHRVMGDSPALNFFPPMTDGAVESLFDQFASFANCSGPEALQCLRSANISTLTFASNKTLEARPSGLYPFSPVTDGKFIKERPSVAFKHGRFAHVPVIFGSNTNEGIGWSERLPDAKANVAILDSTEATVYNFLQGQWPNLTETSFKRVMEIYPLKDFNNSLINQTAQIYGEARYICTAKLITGSVHRRGKTSYGYHYDRPDTTGYTRHGSELSAYFDEPEVDTQELFPTMREFYTSFVLEGKPCADNATDWKPINSSEGKSRIYFHQGQVGMEGPLSDLEERCEFWRSLDDEMNR